MRASLAIAFCFLTMCLSPYFDDFCPLILMIDISDQPKGAYFVIVSAGEKVFTEKIIYR